MHRQIIVVLLHMHSGFPTKILEQMIIKGEHDQASGLLLLSSGCFDTSIWVSKQATDPLLWLSQCPSSRKHIQNAQCCLFFQKHASRPIWRTLSYCDFIYLMVTRQITTLSPGTWYQAKHGSQPFGSELRGWDKLLVWCKSLPFYLVYLCHPTKCGPVTYI